MFRVCSLFFFLGTSIFGMFLMSAGCQLPPERLPVRPLPDDSPPLPYAELLTRARLQSTTANEAFYVNNWGELEDAARGLSQTARFLPRAIEVPEALKNKLSEESKNLAEEADKLRAAAKTRDVKLTNEILQRINLKVRELRPPEKEEAPAKTSKDAKEKS